MQISNLSSWDSPPFQSVSGVIDGREADSFAIETARQQAPSFREMRRHVGSLLGLIAGIAPSSDPEGCPGTAARAILDAMARVTSLSSRQRQVLKFIVAGAASKNIAADLHLSQRTIEHHRAEIMRKTGSTSLPMLARVALAASWSGAEENIGQCSSCDLDGDLSKSCTRCPFGYSTKNATC